VPTYVYQISVFGSILFLNYFSSMLYKTSKWLHKRPLITEFLTISSCFHNILKKFCNNGNISINIICHSWNFLKISHMRNRFHSLSTHDFISSSFSITPILKLSLSFSYIRRCHESLLNFTSSHVGRFIFEDITRSLF